MVGLTVGSTNASPRDGRAGDPRQPVSIHHVDFVDLQGSPAASHILQGPGMHRRRTGRQSTAVD